jgi:hypothetical protein
MPGDMLSQVMTWVQATRFYFPFRIRIPSENIASSPFVIIAAESIMKLVSLLIISALTVDMCAALCSVSRFALLSCF